MRRLACFDVETARCVGCGACSTLVPGVFQIEDRCCRVARDPVDEEGATCDLALLNCPTHAIRVRSRSSPVPAPVPVPVLVPAPGLYAELAHQAEAVRWSLADVPWQELDRRAAFPALRALVREMAFSEHATYSATQRFLQAFYDDIGLSQWIAVWFYEETRHPHVLMEWLRRVGEPLEDDFVLRGRVSTPFMKSRMGTLVTNVISEVTAAQAYRTMAESSPEPVLAAIAQRIAGDEARHAASFLRFARARLDVSERPERERLDALKVLHFWLGDGIEVTHPVNQMLHRLDKQPAGAAGERVMEDIGFDLSAVQRRVTRLLGVLLDLPLKSPTDVAPLVRQLVTEAHGSRGESAKFGSA